MWGEKQKTEPVQDLDARARIAALEDRMALVEKDREALDVEWTDWYDKFRRLHARLAKREQREDAPGSTNGGPTITNPRALALLQRSR